MALLARLPGSGEQRSPGSAQNPQVERLSHKPVAGIPGMQQVRGIRRRPEARRIGAVAGRRSKSTTASNSRPVRIHSLTARRIASPASVNTLDPPYGVIVQPMTLMLR